MTNIKKYFLFVFCVNFYAVNQSTEDVIVYEGESVTLNCTYVTDRVPWLFWYIQYPNDSPKHLQRAVEKPPDLKDKSHAILDKNLKTAPLTVQDVQLSDSAVYYCALRPTVTGNSLTLYKNLTGEHVTCLISVKQQFKENNTKEQDERQLYMDTWRSHSL
uniref:Ig-like domain-containing protein n=1 Tax=Paramormyrops kingsleyae TaxID=1676925 RepID=A0A3B3Q2B1_9TELE